MGDQMLGSVYFQGHSSDGRISHLSSEDIDPLFIKPELEMSPDKSTPDNRTVNNGFAHEVLDIEMCESDDELKTESWSRTKVKKNTRKFEKKKKKKSERRLSDIELQNQILSEIESPCACPEKESLSTGERRLRGHQPSEKRRRRILKEKKAKLFSCDVCFVRFARYGDMYGHKRKHTGEIGYGCDGCKANFTRLSDLNVHKRTHTGEKPYACEECSAKFSRTGDLNVHMRKHTGERPFSCGECNYVCSRAHTLKKHMQIHTGEKPFVCEVCSHRFGQLSDLNIHKRKHTGEKPYTCNECHTRYSQLGSLKRHMKCHTDKKDKLENQS